MILSAIKFLMEHADLIEEIAQAIAAGVSKDDVKKAIRAAVIAASDAIVEEENGTP